MPKLCKSCGADITGTHYNRRYCGTPCKKRGFMSDNPDYFYNKSLGRIYGLTRDDYDRMGESQGWLCAICGYPPTGTNNGKRLVVDHCHETGKVRSLLCSLCNKGIGALRDSSEIARKAAMYLETHSISV